MKPSTSTSAAAGAVGEVLERRALHARWSPSAGPRCGRSRPPTAAPAGSTPCATSSSHGILGRRRRRRAPSRRRTARRRQCTPSRAAGDLRQPAADLLAGVLDRAAVEVGAGAAPRSPTCSAPCRCASGASRTLSQRDAERGRGDLQHLGVQALAHLGAAVVDQHRAVLVDVHERAGLVERGQVERDAELHRRDRQARAWCARASALNRAISACRAVTSPDSSTWSQTRRRCRSG